MSEPTWVPRDDLPRWQPIGNVKGPPGAGATYEHVQTTPSDAWTVEHNLHTYSEPLVLLDSRPGAPVYTDFEYVDEDTMLVRFPTPETGRAYIRN